MSIDLKTVLAALVEGLPTNSRWMIKGSPVDYDFSAIHHELRPVTEWDLGWAIGEWSNYMVLGECDYADGGGAHPLICVCRNDGLVYSLDGERSEIRSLFNSSVEQFIRTFHLLGKYLGSARPLPEDIEARVREVDSTAYPESEWRFMIEHILDRDRGR